VTPTMLMKKRTAKPVFIHISKNAGTSIVKSAGKAIVVAGHRTAASWLAEQGDGAALFAVVRNPFDRVVSEYFYRKRRYEAGEKNPHLANLTKSFEDWVVATFRDGEFRTKAFFNETGVRYNADNLVGETLIWFLPQVRWVDSSAGERLVQHLLRYETLNEDWARFASAHQLHGGLTFRNSSNREQDFRPYYSPRTRALVDAYFHEDLAAFDYSFTPRSSA